MKRRLASLALASLLILPGTSCSAPQASSDSSAPAPTQSSVEVDSATTKSGKTSTGIEVTFTGARVAATGEAGSEQKPGMVPVVVRFEYRNTGSESVPLQSVPLTVTYGENRTEATQPAGIPEGGTARSDLPKQIDAGAVVPVVDTYWAPAGAPLTVKVKPSSSAVSGEVPAVVFSGITAQ